MGEYEAPVFGEGPMGPRLMLIGEAPGAEEAQFGHPFVGRAGKTLDALLDGAGIVRKNIFVTNAVKFRPIRRAAFQIARLRLRNCGKACLYWSVSCFW